MVYKENEGFLGYTVPGSLPEANPTLRVGKSFGDYSPRDGSKKGSSCLSLGGAYSKWRHFPEAEGSSHHSYSKKRRTSPSVPSDVEGEECEAPLSHKLSRHKADIS